MQENGTTVPTVAPPSLLACPAPTAMPRDGAPDMRVVEDWATESGTTIQEFETTYFEQCVAELADAHPAVRQVDAERLVLNDEFWPAAHAA